MDSEKSIFLVTFLNADSTEVERLVSAETAHAAKNHAFHICKASAADVARVLGAGGKVEDAAA